MINLHLTKITRFIDLENLELYGIHVKSLPVNLEGILYCNVQHMGVDNFFQRGGVGVLRINRAGLLLRLLKQFHSGGAYGYKHAHT